MDEMRDHETPAIRLLGLELCDEAEDRVDQSQGSHITAARGTIQRLIVRRAFRAEHDAALALALAV